MQTPADASGEQAESTLIEDQCSSAQMQVAVSKRALWLQKMPLSEYTDVTVSS